MLELTIKGTDHKILVNEEQIRTIFYDCRPGHTDELVIDFMGDGDSAVVVEESYEQVRKVLGTYMRIRNVEQLTSHSGVSQAPSQT